MPTRPREHSGAALIIVVAFIVLISGLVIAFYSRIGTDLVSSRNYAEGVSARQLADSAIGVVMGQIRDATTVKNGAWASQPGMIRVYGTGNDASPNAFAFYKLYSSHDLIVSPPELNKFDPTQFDQAAVATALEVPLGKGGWREQPAYFTDLNEPFDVPAAKVGRTGGAVKRYPIFDPSIAAVHEPEVVETARFERPWQVEGSEIVLPHKLREADQDKRANEAPMPVRWIYVLRDGTLTAPTPLNGPAEARQGGVAHWQALSGGKYGIPTRVNPIVGRIAFWADDDSSKVNINTAGGFISPPDRDEDVNPRAAMEYAGSYWDTPRVNTIFDRGTHKKNADELGVVDLPGLANCQPAQNEFQRYPGHPATTSLNVVFKKLLQGEGASASSSTAFDSEKLYAWLPRLLPGGSRGGTVRFDTLNDRELPIKSATDILDYPAFPSLSGKTFHLYGSVDEMLFTPENGRRRLAEEFLELPGSTITPDLLDKSRFFLTAHSRAPELNLFGRPRVTIWPVWDEPFNTSLEVAKNNPTDALLRFCSRIGGRDFIFSRKNPYSPVADFSIPRNRALMSYLHKLTSKKEGKIPGFGASFEEKLASAPGGRDQLLTEIFDYIRATNLKDSTRSNQIADSTLTSAQKLAEKEKYMYAPKGLVVPTRAEFEGVKVAGFGRFPTITEATIDFYHAGWIGRLKSDPNAGETLIQDPDKLNLYDVSSKLVRAFIAFETYNPMQGYAPTSDLGTERIVHELSLDKDFTMRSTSMSSGVPLGFSRKASNDVRRSSGSTWGGRNFGGTEGFFHTMVEKAPQVLTGAVDDPGDPYPTCNYPFRTQAGSKGGQMDGVRVPIDDTRFDFSGGKADLEIKFGSQLVQTIKLEFPAGSNWPLPAGLSVAERSRTTIPPETRDQNGAPVARDGIWSGDSGGFAKPGDYSGKPRPNVRREWAFSFERRLAWMVTSGGKDPKEQSYDPWMVDNGGDGKSYKDRWRNILQPGDTVRSLVLGKTDKPDLTDPRLLALQTKADGSFFPHPDYASQKYHAATLRRGDGAHYYAPESSSAPQGALIDVVAGRRYSESQAPDLPPGLVAKRRDKRAADFDTGIGNYPDGAFCGKADEGIASWRYRDDDGEKWTFVEPYFSNFAYDPPMDTYFSPNRQVSSAVMFGSLLSAGRGWETLAFSPIPAGDSHPGLLSPRDHLLLDLFTMPVVEPYAISEPFSTAGKVNLNYEIMPFGYLKRTTAMRAALQSLRVTGIPQVNTPDYKKDDPSAQRMNNPRYLVDRDETLRAFDDFFSEFKTNRSKGFFKSATEICDRFLYPKGETHAGKVQYRSKNETSIRQTFWANSTLTGDNLREKPYADLYPRVTTKSNTYTIHYRVQTVRQRPPGSGEDEASHYLKWDESRDTVLTELRGSTTIERYVDPEDKRFRSDFQGGQIDVEKQSLEDAYRFRIIDHKLFSPW